MKGLVLLVLLPLAPLARAEEPAKTYVGAELCVACHDAQAASYAKTPHAAALADEKRPESERACEACHGPGSAHSEAGGAKGVGGLRAFAKTDRAADRNAPCLHCHGGASAVHDFPKSEHGLAGVACTECHSMHAGTKEKLLRAAPPDLCYGCHLQIRAKFALPEHHKVNEGAVSCLDCHAPHGSRNKAALRGANDRACFRCHGEIEGPFVYEHEAELTEGCQRCHDPHGSVNRHLLIRQQVAQLCYECHTVTPRDHAQPRFRDCTRCHVSIHGSNVDPRFLEE
jgi:DmsE family decaheme c-type cytochrome